MTNDIDINMIKVDFNSQDKMFHIEGMWYSKEYYYIDSCWLHVRGKDGGRQIKFIGEVK